MSSASAKKKKKLILLATLALLLAIPLGINLMREVPDTSSLNLPPMPEDEADRFIQMASQNYFFHEYPKAIENNQNAIKVYELRGEIRRIGKIHQSIGDVYKITNQYDSAEKEYLTSADYHSKIGNLVGKAHAFKKIGVMYSELGNSEHALEWYKKSLKSVNKGPPRMILGQIQETLGRHYWEKKKASQAIKHLSQAKAIYVAIGFPMGVEHMTNLISLIQGGYSDSNPQPSKKEL